MIKEVGLALSDVGIVERTMHGEILRLHPFAVFPVFPFLGNLADVDFRVEICGKSLSVVSGVAVNDVEIAHFGEMMLGGVGDENG